MNTAPPAARSIVVRAGAFAVLRTLKFVRHSMLRARTGSRNLRYRVRETDWGQALWKGAAFARAPRESSRRRRIAAQYTARSPVTMDRGAGYCLLPPEPSAELSLALATCRRLFELKVPRADVPRHDGSDAGPSSVEEKRKEKRAFLRNLLDNEDLRTHPELVDFALSDSTLGIATSYLGAVPYLNRVDLLYSVARPADDRIASQLFHLDPEGVTQVKIFVNVFDTHEEAGPFTFIPADETWRIVRAIRAERRREGRPHVGRYTDEEIAAVGGTPAIISLRGPQGTGAAVDTSRCLHLGSRVKPGAFRLCLYIQYCASLEHGNVFDIERYRQDPVRFAAVKHSSRWAGTAVAAPHQMN
jgi:hypothetical protein